MTHQPKQPQDFSPLATPSVPADTPSLPAGGGSGLEIPGSPEMGGIRSVTKPRSRGLLVEEVDVWWGSYSGWAMLPSWLVCVLLSMVIVVLGRSLLPRSEAPLVVVGLSGALWLGQLTRWLYRVFSFNYRLTNRRLYVARGFLYPELLRINLTQVRSVQVRRGTSSYFTGVGDIVLEIENQPPVILTGVFDPRTIACVLETSCEQARMEDQKGVEPQRHSP